MRQLQIEAKNGEINCAVDWWMTASICSCDRSKLEDFVSLAPNPEGPAVTTPLLRIRCRGRPDLEDQQEGLDPSQCSWRKCAQSFTWLLVERLALKDQHARRIFEQIVLCPGHVAG